jgi:hypothetical protein
VLDRKLNNLLKKLLFKKRVKLKFDLDPKKDVAGKTHHCASAKKIILKLQSMHFVKWPVS